MKKSTLIILVVSITLVECLIAFFIVRGNLRKAELKEGYNLGERYDSDKVVMYSPRSTYNYQDQKHEIYERYRKAVSESQFVVHEETAIAIAEAIIKEIYPHEDYQVLNLPTYPKALYYKAENCWEVWLYIYSSRDKPIAVYVNVDSGAVKAIIPADEFSVHNPTNSDKR